MNCERCGARPGVIRYTEYAEGKVRKQLVCPECAADLGFATTAPPGADPGASPLVPPEPAPSPDAPEAPGKGRRCPECGLTAAEFARQSLFGCPGCYEAFDEDLDLLLKRLHGAVAHRGRVPRSSPSSPGAEEPDRLRRELDDAIRGGDFDRAARLRDRLRRHGPTARGEGGARSGGR